MKISQLSKAVLVSMFVAAPALASPIALCGDDKVKAEKSEKSESSEDTTVKTEKKNEKKETKEDKSGTKDSA
jgi:type III secretory pathway component EscR